MNFLPTVRVAYMQNWSGWFEDHLKLSLQWKLLFQRIEIRNPLMKGFGKLNLHGTMFSNIHHAYCLFHQQSFLLYHHLISISNNSTDKLDISPLNFATISETSPFTFSSQKCIFFLHNTCQHESFFWCINFSQTHKKTPASPPPPLIWWYLLKCLSMESLWNLLFKTNW